MEARRPASYCVICRTRRTNHSVACRSRSWSVSGRHSPLRRTSERDRASSGGHETDLKVEGLNVGDGEVIGGRKRGVSGADGEKRRVGVERKCSTDFGSEQNG